MPDPRDWFRRYTTVEDPLDDGIENFSDLQGAKGIAAEPEVDPALVAGKQRAREQARLEIDGADRATLRRSALGLFLAGVMCVAGTLLIAFPVHMRVLHVAVRYVPTTIERISPMRSRLYGGSLLAAGIAVAAFAWYRPRKPGDVRS